MYLIVNMFEPERLNKGKYFLAKEFLKDSKELFPEYVSLVDKIEGAYCWYKTKYINEPMQKLDIKNLRITEDSINFNFEVVVGEEIDQKSFLEELHVLKKEKGWYKKNGFVNFYLLNKKDFDKLIEKKEQGIKANVLLKELSVLKTKNDWQGIINKFEPLESLKDNKIIWNNRDLLYEIAYAVCQIGSFKNNKNLSKLKHYRELGMEFIKRCYELEPNNPYTVGMIAYKYKQNFDELRGKKRKDGNKLDELNNSIYWYSKAIKMQPNNLKYNYRYATVLLEKEEHLKFEKIDNNIEWQDIEDKIEKHLKKTVELYNKMDERGKKLNKSEYSRSIYNIAIFHEDKIHSYWTDYVANKIFGNKFSEEISEKFIEEDYPHVLKASKLMQKCFEIEFGVVPQMYELKDFKNLNEKRASLAINLIYKLAYYYTHRYFAQKNFIYGGSLCVNVEKDEEGNVISSSTKTPEDMISREYYKLADKYYQDAKKIANFYRNKGYNIQKTNFLNERQTWLYILGDELDRVDKRIEQARGYTKNVYSAYLLLKGNYEKARNVASEAVEDSNNLARYNAKKVLQLAEEMLNKK